ncbi:MAG: hypothetical protein WDA27_00120 [Actinomycetota bacterium]
MARRGWAALLRLRSEAAGFTLVELMAGLSILVVGFAALASASGAGSRLLVQGRQRHLAAGEANARIEQVRNIPYANVALNATPAHSTDEGDPDYFVDTLGNFDDGGDGTYEPLVVGADGAVAHIDGPFTSGVTRLTVYQYVTWVDDPAVSGAQDYKRVVIVVSFDAAANPGRAHTVHASALLTSGSVTVGGSQAGATQGTPSPSATPTPTPTGGCAGDTQGPTGSFTILSGTGASEGFTASRSVTISVAPSDPCAPISVALSNDNSTYGTQFTYNSALPTVSWTLTTGDGGKHVWARYSDALGNVSTVGPVGITLDATPPGVPGTLTKTASCQGSSRTVNLAWGSASDAHLLGYRVYKRVDAGAFLALLTTSANSSSDTDSKTLSSLEYRIVAYDRAGNEGSPTNVVSLAKNACS